MQKWPITIYDQDGMIVDRCGNVESTVALLYGDLSTHPGTYRRITCSEEFFQRLQWEACINADCFGLPMDVVEIE